MRVIIIFPQIANHLTGVGFSLIIFFSAKRSIETLLCTLSYDGWFEQPHFLDSDS